jgi:hypothetical protein
MRNLVILLCIVGLIIPVFVGCTQRVGDFTIISTKNVELGAKYTKLDRFQGVDSKPDILFIPLGVPDLKQAVDNCIEAGKGELLTNAVVESGYWTVIVYGERKYTVTGDVWAKASSSDLLNPNIELFELQVGTTGFILSSTADPTQKVKVDYFVSRF